MRFSNQIRTASEPYSSMSPRSKPIQAPRPDPPPRTTSALLPRRKKPHRQGCRSRSASRLSRHQDYSWTSPRILAPNRSLIRLASPVSSFPQPVLRLTKREMRAVKPRPATVASRIALVMVRVFLEPASTERQGRLPYPLVKTCATRGSSQAYYLDSGIEDTLGGPFARRRWCSLGHRPLPPSLSKLPPPHPCYGATRWGDKAGIFPRSRLANGQNSPPIIVGYPTIRVVSFLSFAALA